jgi:aldose 1-epimerase
MNKTFLNWTALMSAGVGALLIAGCTSSNCCKMKSTSNPTPFGTADGKAVTLYTLRNSKGAEAQIMNYGGIVTSLKVADKNGKFSDVVLGYDNLAAYLKETPYFGCLVGRYGNRIAKGKFTLNGKEYTLATNNGENALHGGVKGFDKVVWTVGKVTDSSLELHYISKNGEEGYPGNLTVKAVYELTEDNALRLDYTATTDAATPCNLTHHSYFNFAGKGDILDHVVTIYADKFTPVDSGLIPIGELRPVKGTPFDFTMPTTIGARINGADEQLKLGKGYDHNWVVNQTTPGVLTKAATVSEASSGRVMEVWSTSPGLQFYSGNFLDGTLTGKGNWVYQFRNGFCMEPQHFPDSPNQASFPSTILNPGETYRNTIIYKFSVR